MNKRTLYIAEIGEAIRFFKENTYEYDRLSIILLDNVIEVMLKHKLRNEISHKYYKEGKSFIDIEAKLKELELHENVTICALRYNLINADNKRVIDFAHIIRNHQYHEPREYSYFLSKDNNILIKFGVLSLIEFLINNFLNLSPEDNNDFFMTVSERQKLVYKKNSINTPEQFILKLKEVFVKADKKPNELLQEIIEDDFRIIDEFYECEASEDWDKFYNLTLEYFNQYLDYVKSDRNKKIENKIKSFNKLSDIKIKNLKERYVLQKLDTGKALEKMIVFSDEYNAILSGIKFYQIEQDRIAMQYDS